MTLTTERSLIRKLSLIFTVISIDKKNNLYKKKVVRIFHIPLFPNTELWIFFFFFFLIMIFWQTFASFFATASLIFNFFSAKPLNIKIPGDYNNTSLNKERPLYGLPSRKKGVINHFNQINL